MYVINVQLLFIICSINIYTNPAIFTVEVLAIANFTFLKIYFVFVILYFLFNDLEIGMPRSGHVICIDH